MHEAHLHFVYENVHCSSAQSVAHSRAIYLEIIALALAFSAFVAVDIRSEVDLCQKIW